MHKISGLSSGTMRSTVQPVEGFSVTMRRLRYLHVQRLLERCPGNYTKAARILGVTLATFYRYVDRPDLVRDTK